MWIFVDYLNIIFITIILSYLIILFGSLIAKDSLEIIVYFSLLPEFGI